MKETQKKCTVFAPGSIGNVGPGFDVLGLAIADLGDEITIQLNEGASEVVEITGRDAGLIPTKPEENCALIAANAFLERKGLARGAQLWIKRSLPVSGGLGASAAASVGGALAAAYASGESFERDEILSAALEGEAAVAGTHLDNIAPCLFGGLCIVQSVEPPRVIQVSIKQDWKLIIVSPNIKIDTKKSRGVLPTHLETKAWVLQMANSASLVASFSQGLEEQLKQALVDNFAEPARSKLIPHFDEVKKAALDAGAMGCSISGGGPSVFAIAENDNVAKTVAAEMLKAFGDLGATAHVSGIGKGAKKV